MKDCYKDKRIFEICGTLDEDENGKLFITVEDKDGAEYYGLDEIIHKLVGTRVSIKNEVEF